MSDDPISKRFGNVGDGPRTEPMRRHTMAYSIVDSEEARRRHGGTASAKLAEIAPTEMMQAVVPQVPVIINSTETTTVRTIVSQLIERDVNAWTALPQEVRDMMLSAPSTFTIIPNKIAGGMPHISFKGVELRWNGAECWVLISIRR